MNNINYKILITTSGTGSRLGELTKNTNKALIKIAGKEAIRRIIDAYSSNLTIVITLGFLGSQVKQFLISAYPKRKFEFAEVDNYVGDGSSLACSLRCAKDYLQCPFIFHACDTLVTDPIPKPDCNWIAGYLVEAAIKDKMDLNQYRTHKVAGEKIIKLLDKGEPDFQSIHIGLDGIYDYKTFWQTLDKIYVNDPNNNTLSEVHVLDSMLAEGISFKWIPYDVWLDTGNLEALAKTEKYLEK